MIEVRERKGSVFFLAIDRELRVSTLHPEDAEKLFKLVERNRSRLRPWIPASALPESVSAARRLIIESFFNSLSHSVDLLAEYPEYYQELDEYLPPVHPPLEMGIWAKGILVGQLMLVRLQDNFSAAEFGYWIDGEKEGQGIVTRCVGGLMDYAIDNMGIERFMIGCAADNRRSSAIPERLGYRLLARVPDAELVGDLVYDRLIYEICSTTWNEQGRDRHRGSVVAHGQPGGMIQ